MNIKPLLIGFVAIGILTGMVSAASVTFSNVTVTAIKNTSVVIQYDTDIAATGQIEYGLSTSYGSLTKVEGLSYWQPIEITGLTPGTTYHYRIRTKDYKGYETISGDYTFTTRTTAELEAVIRAARINGDLPKTYYVKPTSSGGSNANNGLTIDTAWATPNYAAQVAEAGDTILVASGTYTGYIGFGYYVTPVHHGIPEAPIVMKAYNGTPDIGQILIRADYVTIDGFVSHGASGHGIDVRYTRGTKILNSEVYDSSGSDGIYFWDNTYFRIENAKVHDTGWNGIGIKPSITFPSSQHHIIVRNSQAYDIPFHNAFDVQGDYMTFENSNANNSDLAPMGLLGDHNVVNNFTGSNGNNGIAVRGSLRNSLVLNSTLLGGPIMRQSGVVGNTTFYNNYITYSRFGFLFSADVGNLIEQNNIITQEINGYTYGIEGNGSVTIRNEKNTPYRVNSINGATITVEYTDGRVFSVDGSGQYTLYTFSSGVRTIAVTGLTTFSKINGTVTNGTNPIEGATITDGTRINTTDINGKYILNNVPTGTYMVTASRSGYTTQSKPATVLENQITTVDFTLTPGTTTTTSTTSTSMTTTTIPTDRWVVGSGGVNWIGNVIHNNTQINSKLYVELSGIYDDFLGSELDLTKWTLENIAEGYANYSIADGKIAWTKTRNGTGWSGKRIRTPVSLTGDFNISMLFNWTSSSGAMGQASLGLYNSTGSVVAYVRFDDFWGGSSRYENYASINGSSYDGDYNLASAGQAVISLVRKGSNTSAYWNGVLLLNNTYVGEITNIYFDAQYYTTYSGATFIADYIYLGKHTLSGNLTSIVKDAESVSGTGSVWKQIKFDGAVPTGTNVSIYVNSTSCGGFVIVQNNAASEIVYDLPICAQENFASWRLVLKINNASITPEIYNVTFITNLGTSPTTTTTVTTTTLTSSTSSTTTPTSTISTITTTSSINLTTSTTASTTSTIVTTTTSTTLTTTTSVSSSTTTTSTLPLCSVKGDLLPCNGLVDDWELLDYINRWAKGLVLDFDLLEAIKTWAGG